MNLGLITTPWKIVQPISWCAGPERFLWFFKIHRYYVLKERIVSGKLEQRMMPSNRDEVYANAYD